jgi:hypothetical protein
MKFVLACLVLLCVTARADVPATQPQSEQQQIETWWADLEKSEPQSTRAILNFADKPAAAVAFFREKLKPLALTEEDLDKAIGDLASDEESVWKPAFEKLEYFDPRLARELQPLMSGVNDPVARCRLVEILCDRTADSLAGKNIELRPLGGGGDGYNFAANNSSWWAEHKIERLNNGGGWNSKKKWTRATRAIVLLEHIGNADAILILRDMATGNPDASPTKAAKEALGMPIEEKSGENKSE